jgi:hypothetical protein
MKVYFRPYDKTIWLPDRCHEVEVSPGISHGGMTLRSLDHEHTWTMLDTVWFDHQKTGRVVELTSVNLLEYVPKTSISVRRKVEQAFKNLDPTAVADWNEQGEPRTFLASVTTRQLFYFEEKYSNGWSPRKIVREWFRHAEPNGHHAARDGAKVGMSKSFLDVTIHDAENCGVQP